MISAAIEALQEHMVSSFTNVYSIKWCHCVFLLLYLPWRVLGWIICSAVVTRWQRTTWPMLPRERESFRGKHTMSFCNRETANSQSP